MVSEAIEILLMVQKSGFYSPVEGTVVFIPLFTVQGFCYIQTVVVPTGFQPWTDGVTWHHGVGLGWLAGHNETTVICQVWTLLDGMLDAGSINSKLGGGNSNIFYCHPYLKGEDSHFD